MKLTQSLRASLLLAGLVSVTACVPCLNPLYTEADLLLDEALAGSWSDSDGASWRFELSSGKSYTLTYDPRGSGPEALAKAGRPGEFKAHLLRLGDDLFLDLYPDYYPDGSDLGNALLAIHLIPAHTFSRIWIDKDAVRIGMLDPEWLDKAMTSGEVEIAHKHREEGLLLTASTPELQTFARTIAGRPEAFGVVVELARAES